MRRGVDACQRGPRAHRERRASSGNVFCDRIRPILHSSSLDNPSDLDAFWSARGMYVSVKPPDVVITTHFDKACDTLEYVYSLEAILSVCGCLRHTSLNRLRCELCNAYASGAGLLAP